MKAMKKHIILTASAMITAALMSGCIITQASDEPVPTTAEPTVTVTVSETVTETSTVTETETTTTPTVTETTVTTTELPFEDTPENAYARLTMSFIQPEGGEIAPDDYAGVYSYFGKLFVAITTDEPSEYYTELLSDYTCVTYTTVSRSFNELSDVCERAAELLEPEFGVAEYYIDVPSNKAAVAIINGDPKSAQNYLKTVDGLGFELHDLEIIMAELQ